MTKEEYSKLLNSDYWKGYSYSIIKERNFTCEDCGAYYPGERNKLQVHHLVYRDIMPWSYKPEEMVVLCRECHQRRHGIVPASAQEDPKYVKSYSSDSIVKDEKAYHTDTRETKNSFLPKKSNLVAIFVLVLLGVYAIYLASLDHPSKTNSSIEESNEELYSLVEDEVEADTRALPDAHRKAVKVETTTNGANKFVGDEQDNNTTEYINKEVSPIRQEDQNIQPIYSSLDEKIHRQIVERAKHYGVSTEGTTSEIQDRIIHQQVVERAKHYGVSTDGTTSEIQERIIQKMRNR